MSIKKFHNHLCNWALLYAILPPVIVLFSNFFYFRNQFILDTLWLGQLIWWALLIVVIRISDYLSD